MDRFHALLAAERHNPEAAAMHRLLVFTYFAQHPSPCKSWLRAAQREWMREIFEKDRDWLEVTAWPKDRTRRQKEVDRVKERHAGAPETSAAGHAKVRDGHLARHGMPGSPGYPFEYPGKVEVWGRSLAEHRFF